MTTTIKAPPERQPPVSTEKKPIEKKAKRDISSITPALGNKFLQTFFKQPREITVRTWIIGNDTERMVSEKTVKLGEEDVYIDGRKYTIIYDAIQNIRGKLVYNTKYGVANGALRYRINVDKEVDAQIRSKMAQKENLHAIWSTYRMPLIIALIAIVGAIIGFTLFAVVTGQLSTANNCLNNEQCMLNKITVLRAQAQAEAQTNAR